MDYNTEGVTFTLTLDFSHIFLVIKYMMKIIDNNDNWQYDNNDSMFIIKTMAFTLPWLQG